MGPLVDLSLFAVSPTNDYHFAMNDQSPQPAPTLRTATTMPAWPASAKPLPPIPSRRTAPALAEGRSGFANPSRCILDRMKRLRLSDSRLQTSSALSEPQPTQKTLQQRRKPETDVAALTIPTAAADIPQATQSAATLQRPSAPMIWLSDENMWLVAEDGIAASPQQMELYGYYAPAPISDPSDYLDMAPRAYAASNTPSEDSPVRTQFRSLIDTPRETMRPTVDIAPFAFEEPHPGQRIDIPGTAPEPPRATRAQHPRSITTPGHCWVDAPRRSTPVRATTQDCNAPISPLFQEAMSGVGFAHSRSEALLPGTPPAPAPARPSRWYNRPDSAASPGVGFDAEEIYVAPLRLQRRTVLV